MTLQKCGIRASTQIKHVSRRRAPLKSLRAPYSAPVDGSIPPSKQRFVPSTGTYPQGFSISSTHVGIKPSNTRFPDLAVLVSDRPCTAAAVFTQNRFRAAPVKFSVAALRTRARYNMRAVVINSGCANAVTGDQGFSDAKAMAIGVNNALAFNQEPSSTLVMSTGVIGQPLPISKILDAIPTACSSLSSSHDSWLAAARAICTTDTFPKLLSTTFSLPSSPGTTYSLAGLAKGAGMIHPNMATLLGIFATDAPLSQRTLQTLLERAMKDSFDSISVDGDTSTNDTVAILANGAAGGSLVLDTASKDVQAMQEVLTPFAQTLSQLVVRDGEGATKFVRVRVINAKRSPSAKRVAATIARSPLVKTALYGKDANWGRIVCAIGNAKNVEHGTVVPGRTSVSFLPMAGGSELKLLVNGKPEEVDEEQASKLLQEEELEIRVDLGTGEEEASYWFCDFSHEYVTINADYRT